MPPWWALPVLGAGLSAVGDVLGLSAGKALSGSAHQREVRDLRRAGLNPILSAGGSGAQLPQVPDFGRRGGEAASSAMAAKRLQGELDLMQAQAQKATQEGLLAGKRQAFVELQGREAMARTKHMDLQNILPGS